ncbi:xanthine dehydrogenase accessory factor [Rhizobium sp. BK196]|uniref:XdhC family protein n=1 Tax=unclassified Rhizobium TaxID=2613769 RepID=UPI001619DA29|nr:MULTISPECIES: XdhC family protein [unclassified Rhizobium]MBB3314022.1 xanthine dehydrogenase accessory factor [Rhizobium sp. BK196]MBB3464244.1 xanthine dehydrogenase accessory factor [Rhizobium sp. BK377]
MNETVFIEKFPTPIQAKATDDPIEILRFAEEQFQRGAVAVAMLVSIRGGAARSPGSLIAVAADGSYCGFVSGGCIESTVAFEALLAISQGKDRVVMFGQGSPFFDIVLPCGGGLTVAIHVLRTASVLRFVLERLERRQPAGVRYSPRNQVLAPTDPPAQSGWIEEDFLSAYRPRTRVVISGRSLEAQMLARCATVLDFDVTRLESADGDYVARAIDAYTAVVLLHHDLDAEKRILAAALASPAFYIGALGSTRTHAKRIEMLASSGVSKADIERIKAPIGLFGPARDSASLALSVLAEIAAVRQDIGEQ